MRTLVLTLLLLMCAVLIGAALAELVLKGGPF